MTPTSANGQAGPARSEPDADEPYDADGPYDADEPYGTDEPYDVVGVGTGPFNLALAALADGVDGLRTAFFDSKPAFSWHPGLLLEGTTLQVPFLADLVTLIDPTSRWSFLSYLREHDRLFRFYFYERFHVPRREYDDYCRWVAHSLPSTRFGTRVDEVRWHPDAGLFRISVRDASTPAGSGPAQIVTARHVVLGVGTEPTVPSAFGELLGPEVFHSADYRARRDLLADAGHVTVVGSGQSGAEVFAELLRDQPASGHRLTWVTRTPAFAPMEYSKLGLEQFTPDFVRYFHQLDQQTKDAAVPSQWQLYKAIDASTIAQIYDLLYERSVGGAEVDAVLLPGVEVASAARTGGRIRLGCWHRQQDQRFEIDTDRVVLATGYSPRRPALLDPVAGLLDLDAQGRFQVDEHYRVATSPAVGGHIYIQNGELHTHGVGAPDLGLGAWRAAVILDDVTGGGAYRLPRPSAFTTFGAPAGQPATTASVDDVRPARSAPVGGR